MTTDKQLTQITANLRKKQNLPALPSGLAARTNKPDVQAPPCRCGKPRMAMWFEHLGRYVWQRACKECEPKMVLIDIRAARVEKAEKYNRILKRAIPELFLKAHIRHVPDPVLKMIAARERGQGIFLWGKVGRGKTYTACALMRLCIVTGKRARRARFRDIIHEVQHTYTGEGSTEKVLEQYLAADLLSIEDVGTGKKDASEFDTEILLKLIDKRMEARKTTIITSNKNMEGMVDVFDTRIFSRLTTFLIIEMTGTDRRKE